MAAKKKIKKSAPAKKSAAKRPMKASRKAPARKTPRKPPPKASGPMPAAAKMAAFSKQVLEEEEEPVQVRSFIEARQGIDASKELDVKTGQAKPVLEHESDVDASGDDDDDDDDFPPMPGKPQMEPLTGPLAVPKRTVEEFRVGASAKKGKKGAPPTKEDLGRIELRMQRGSGDTKIADANPDYLQRSFNQAAAKGKVAASTSPREESHRKEDEFQVAADKPMSKMNRAIADFGDVEIAQQTRSGSKKLGKIDVEDEEK